ncbi:hypothetical protein DENSPDRAFT_844879 [Dentipellis sp. KUC8613]|nr:hypothetical protein DENSPDRAFT_844879 [Dentipellis sp. KUC8613]
MQCVPDTPYQRTPPEVWLSIFEQATFVSHAFDTDTSDPFDVPGTPIFLDPLTQNMLRTALITKQSLALVCRSWHALATPLLYQAVSVTNDRSLLSLRETLVGRDTRLAPAGSLAVAVRVRRLDLFRWSPSLETAEIFIDVLRRLPDLEVFCASTRFHLLSGILSCVQAFIANCAPSLRRCTLSPLSKVTQPQFEHLFTRCPHLSHFFIPYPVWAHSPMPLLLPESLTSVSINCPLQNLSHSIPSLQHVYVWASGSFFNKVETFLSIQGQYIRTLQIHMSSLDSRGDLLRYTNCCARYCPNLVHLILIVDTWKTCELPRLSILATVTHLGVYMGREISPLGLDDCLSFLSALFKYQDAMPRVIRTLNTLTELEQKDLQVNLALRMQVASVAARCRFEGADGNELLLPREDYGMD